MTFQSAMNVLLAAVALAATPMIGSAQSTTASDLAESGVEAIPVHGEWTVTVLRNGDPVERRDFANALVVPDGAQLLRDVLTQKVNLFGWGIGLRDTNSSEPLCSLEAGDEGYDCLLIEWVDLYAGLGSLGSIPQLEGEAEPAGAIGRLSVATPTSGDQRLALVLSGTNTATRDGDVDGVVSFAALCRGEDCTPDPLFNYNLEMVPFTQKDLSEGPISLLSGDEVRVTVVLSFFAPSVELEAIPPASPTENLQAPSLPSPSGDSGE